MNQLEHTVALEREAFLYGDCWWLALTLHHLFGFTLDFAVYWPEGVSDTDLVEWEWDHVFVETHTGDPLDVEGMPDVRRWRQAPVGHERGFHLTRDDNEIRALLHDLVGADLQPLPKARQYDVDPLSAVVRLAWQFPEAFRNLPLAGFDDLPTRLASSAQHRS